MTKQTIESVREELEKKIKEEKKLGQYYSDLVFHSLTHKLMGFNLRVELAQKEFHISKCPLCTHEVMKARREERELTQKEFLDFIEFLKEELEDLSKVKMRTDRIHSLMNFNDAVDNKIEELKKSLGVKE